MLYLLSFFLPPLALLLAGMPLQAILNFIVWTGSFFGVFFFVYPGMFLWSIAVAHAILMIHNKRADRRARRVIEAIERRG